VLGFLEQKVSFFYVIEILFLETAMGDLQ